MILRPRQQEFNGKCLDALKKHGNTVGIATVGFGKSVSMAAMNAGFPRSLTIQHRIELLEQNRGKFAAVSPETRTAIFAASHKRWADDGATFAMIQTLQAGDNIERMKPVDILTIDEAHHAQAEGYRKIVAKALELNPKTLILGVTATPERCDGKGLRPVFTNVADVVTLGEMVQSGFLVRPRTMPVEIVGEQLEGLREETRKRRLADFDMDAAEKIMNTSLVTERMIEEWKRVAGKRRTIGFATNVKHSEDMAAAFREAGIASEHLDGTTPKGERKAILRRLDSGETQVVWNCAVLTEGFDSPSVSCVILNRPAMHKSTMIQMIGRGLRTISEPEKYPGIVKDDCIVIDLGASLINHGSLEADADIEGRQGKKGEAPKKICPECDTEIPASSRMCPLCGHVFETKGREKDETGSFILTEIDLLEISPFRWEELWPTVTAASGLTAESFIVQHAGIFWAYGKIQGQPAVRLVSRTHCRLTALAAADDFLRLHGDASAAKKSKRWIHEPASDKQRQMLGIGPFDPVNRYRASCLLGWKFAENKIKASVLALCS